MFQSRKVRLKPNKVQAKRMYQNFGAARFIYNWGLEQLHKYWEENKDKEKKDRAKRPSAFDLKKELTRLKNSDEKYAWLKDVDSRILSFTLANLDDAFKRFFTGTSVPTGSGEQAEVLPTTVEIRVPQKGDILFLV